ncbi:ATP-binding protein [Bordetella sp. FB-8]|uniref:ATP-binding protein n=1 Tax=Bordetella sp. FB-8 TaxID=1159870 RepID=UPI00037878A1|nr:ATP-binding protein [Bordetella sp. FB-8]
MGSIRQRLTLIVLSGVAAVWLYSLYSSYRQAAHEVGEWDKARVEQVARALLVLDLDDLPVFAKASVPPRDDDGDNDQPMPLLYEIMATDGRVLAASPGVPAFALPGRAAGGQSAERARWYVYTTGDPARGRIVRIFEQCSHRSAVSAVSAKRVARPLLFALPVLAVLIWIAIGRSLTPLRILSKAIEERSSDSLETIEIKNIPDEVVPLVSALNMLLRRLRQSLDRERAFTSDAAHELKTPLAAIKVQAQVALTARDPQRQRRAMQRVVDAVDRSAHLADQLLALARLEESTPLPSSWVDLAQTAQACLAEQHANAQRKQMSLVLRSGGQVMVQAPPALVRILFDNLVDNAIKYGRAGGRIEIAACNEAGAFGLEVKDDGPGVDPQDMSRLNDRFFRGADHTEKGSGLGLSIVARIVTQLGGKLEYAAGIEGRGLGVRIRLPASIRPPR